MPHVGQQDGAPALSAHSVGLPERSLSQYAAAEQLLQDGSFWSWVAQDREAAPAALQAGDACGVYFTCWTRQRVQKPGEGEGLHLRLSCDSGTACA
jgi:hypothetical protein